MLPDRRQALGPALAPHGVLARGQVAVRTPDGAEHRKLGLPGFLAGPSHHPDVVGVQQLLAPFLQLARPQSLALFVDPAPERAVLEARVGQWLPHRWAAPHHDRAVDGVRPPLAAGVLHGTGVADLKRERCPACE
ncbi:hypothetical protein GCM10012280_68770 [Wenjunlia tyrosinilytica]|uniref:Uncharacterized protein n=1 Tax=Wenjunlia tyrosinilytica TaxID=1544741 RepID=A0A918E2C9_9ACTN|nr:hypothetical protein GCM10012280_68770 [Wenjunlia tyrosinilytica]